MCGITGILAFRGQVDPAVLRAQRDAMEHRGPDSFGTWCSEDGRVGLAHRRLAIIDLTPGGHQPMLDARGRIAITFNGEIYNYLVLKDRLRALGHEFHTQSDTEVIIAAYRQWGRDAVSQLHGMFAFALYDSGRGEVLLARDRAGEKPLYYRVTPERLAFASEIKALLQDPACPRTVRRESLNEYLAYGYVTGGHSMLVGIERVLPGTIVTVNLDQGTSATHRYWELPETVVTREPVPTEQLVDELHALLRTAVERQLVADVPVGVLLSGGVDSSLVTAIAAQVSGTPVRTFTVRFPGDARFDEGPFARMVAEHLGTQHTELEAQPADEALLRRLVAQFDDPIADSSMIPTFLVSQEIRRHATVALGGDGGDELFGGYFRYPIQIRQDRLRRRIPAYARAAAAGVASRVIPDGMPGRGFLQSLAGDAGTSIANAGRIFRDDERAALSASLRCLSVDALRAPERARAGAMTHRTSLLQRATAVDYTTYMVDDVLLKVDRASMLTSLEVRAPFLDPAVIEFAFSRLPDALRATEQDRKVVLRGLGARLLPPALDLRRKQGFSIPIDNWMRGPWRSLLDAEVESAQPSIIDSAALCRYQQLLMNGRSVGNQLFAMLALRLWERHYGISDVR